MIRKGLHSKEIETLQHNLNHCTSLVARAQDQMVWELNNRKRDHEVIRQDIQNSYEHRIAAIKDESSKTHDEQNFNISGLHANLADVSL